MPEVTKETLSLLSFLLPGFLAGWIFYSFTAHQKPTQVERIIQALVFTVLIKVLVTLTHETLEFCGKWISLGVWSENSELISSLIIAIAFGFVASHFTNNDELHAYLRKKGFSKRSSHPSEWCYALSTYPAYVVLNLRDQRRLYGWPESWPLCPEKGHFFIIYPSWLDDENNIELSNTEGILIDVKDVEFVEIMKKPEAPNE